MKAFIVSTVLFLLLISAIYGNALYVKNVSKHITLETEKLKAENYPQNIANELEKYWLKHRGFVGLSVGHEELDLISQTIISLNSYCESGDIADASVYLSVLQDAVEEMGRHEEISFENLF